MKHFNRVAALLLCLFIAAAPCMGCFYSYATVPSVWQPLNSDSELVEAFQYYCKSRDLTIDGSVANAVTQFTTGAFNGCCNTLGINITQLQAELMVDRSNAPDGVRYLFSSTGIDAYNRIFAQFLQDNNLSVGDQNVDQEVYSGRYFTDDQGNNCLVFEFYDSGSLGSVTPISIGTPYIYSSDDLLSYLNSANGFTRTLSYNNLTYTINGIYDTFTANGGGKRISFYVDSTASGGTAVIVYRNAQQTYFSYGYSAVGYNTYTNNYYIGCYLSKSNNNSVSTFFPKKRLNTVNNANGSSGITINLVSNQINNNTYEGDTIINNNGTPEEDTPSGGTPPDWDLGGGQGTVDDGNGNTWNITWPSFELPDLNIDWTINGLSEKFPFSIPFDLVALVTVLSAEPEAPEFSGTIDLKVYQWNYDLDFSQFDTVAAVFRTAETILFVFGLIMITRKIIRG